MLDLRKLQTFQVAAATNSFTRAAAQLGCCQSSVTVHIQALELELGVPLFERRRSSKTVVLTEVGRRALVYADQLLTLAEETKAALHSAAASVGGGDGVSVPPDRHGRDRLDGGRA